MAKGISPYELEEHIAKATKAIAEMAKNAEGFEIVVSAKANELPVISYKIDKLPLIPFYKAPRKDENDG